MGRPAKNLFGFAKKELYVTSEYICDQSMNLSIFIIIIYKTEGRIEVPGHAR